jgi:hypothetical protein
LNRVRHDLVLVVRGEWERSRGGRTSKIHCLADDRGRPVAFALRPGNVADISMAVPLLSAVTSRDYHRPSIAAVPVDCAANSGRDADTAAAAQPLRRHEL